MLNKKILLLGAQGQLGQALKRSLAPLGILESYSRSGVDLQDLAALKKILTLEKPEIIVNAAAYTAVDKAEGEPEKAFAINAAAVQVLAEYASACGAWLLHYSTDYVFDGKKESPYLETDVAQPINVYGQSKWAGEHAIVQSGSNYLIIRTSWLYAAHGQNFLKTILRLAQERESLQVVADQRGTPTQVDFLAAASAAMLSQLLRHPNASALHGVYHVTAAGITTWYDYAVLLLTEAQAQGFALACAPAAVLPVMGADYPAAARRPRYSGLNTQKVQEVFGLALPPWQRFLPETIKTLGLCPALLKKPAS